MNKQEGIGIYKLGQKVALYGYIDAINIEDVNDIENTTTLKISTPVKTFSVNPKYEGVTIDLNKPKPVVPQYVADWVDNSREYDYEFCDFFDSNHQSEEVYEWLNCKNRRQSELNALALSTLIVHGRDAVIVEEEKKYRVILKGNSKFPDYLVDTVTNGFHFYNNIYTKKREHTRKELEEAGFGWVFDCEGIEIEEVEK